MRRTIYFMKADDGNLFLEKEAILLSKTEREWKGCQRKTDLKGLQQCIPQVIWDD